MGRTAAASQREIAFARAYFRSGNAAQAARETSPELTPGAARVMGSRFLKRAQVRAEVTRLGEIVTASARSVAVQAVRKAAAKGTKPMPQKTGDQAVDTLAGAVIDGAWVQAQLVENVLICMGKEPVVVTVPFGEQTRDVSIRKHDAAGANRALQLIGKAVGFAPNNKTQKTIEGTVAMQNHHQQLVEEMARKFGLPLTVPADYDPTKE